MIKASAVALIALAFLAQTPAKAADVSQQEKNKQTVLHFYDLTVNKKDVDGALALMGPVYIQHNARSTDGKDGFRIFVDRLRQKFPQAHADIVHEFADGDYVILHVHFIWEPGTRGDAVVDIYRLADGAIVEHWDVLQPVPENIPHPNTMF